MQVPPPTQQCSSFAALSLQGDPSPRHQKGEKPPRPAAGGTRPQVKYLASLHEDTLPGLGPLPSAAPTHPSVLEALPLLLAALGRCQPALNTQPRQAAQASGEGRVSGHTGSSSRARPARGLTLKLLTRPSAGGPDLTPRHRRRLQAPPSVKQPAAEGCWPYPLLSTRQRLLGHPLSAVLETGSTPSGTWSLLPSTCAQEGLETTSAPAGT